MALADASRAFVADADFDLNGGVIAVDLATGEQTKVAASTEFHRPFGIARRSDGQLVVAYVFGADETPGTVMLVDPASGAHTPFAPDVDFFRPVGVAIDSAGDVFVVENDFSGVRSVLHRFDHDGAHSVVAAGEPPGSQYSAVTHEPGGGILVGRSPAGPGPADILRFDPATGSFTAVSHGQTFGSPMGLAVEASGGIIVADPHLGAGIVRIDPATGVETHVSPPSPLALPTGVAIVP